jgi:outer membrane protein assembly factor BamA
MQVRAVGWVLAAVLVGVPVAHALDEIETEEEIAELLASPLPPEEEEKETKTRQWAVLPQVGFGPETGPVGGAKFEHHDLGGVGLTLDLDGTFALEKQQSFAVEVGTPHLLDERFLILFRAGYDLDPTFEFFGLGNNDVGPDPASTHHYQQAEGALTVGWRPWRRLALNFGAAIRHVRVGRGDRDDDDTPFTLDVFPNLPGVEGGFVNPLELSLVWSTRDQVVRPTRGWRAILKVSHTNRSLHSDYEFTRYVADLGYLYSFWEGRHILGARLNGGFIDGPERDTPFWELEELGGSDTLRGFFPHRFLGSQRVMGNLEYRGKIVDFDFFDIWHVHMDGVVFGEAGRVFIDGEELRDEFSLNDDIIERVVENLQYSYGGGLRFALSQALVARVDVGFSEEELGLVYLAFGHTF